MLNDLCRQVEEVLHDSSCHIDEQAYDRWCGLVLVVETKHLSLAGTSSADVDQRNCARMCALTACTRPRDHIKHLKAEAQANLEIRQHYQLLCC